MNYWFEQDWKTTKIDSAIVDSLRSETGMNNVVFQNDEFVKLKPAVRIDVNAIAQGYSVDVVSRYLESEGIFNYLVEIGGEVRASGTKPDEKLWMVGIDKPADSNEERELTLTVRLKDRALATSGNYRKFVEIDGQKFGHSLNPQTGYPAKTDVLSATIITEDCMTADAYATAFMVQGFQQSKRMVEEENSLEAVLIYSDQGKVQTWISEGLPDFILEAE